MAQPETITRSKLIPASGIPSDAVVRIDEVIHSATTAGSETRTSVALIMTGTVVYTPAAHGNRRGGTARVGSGVNMGHRQVTPNQVPSNTNKLLVYWKFIQYRSMVYEMLNGKNPPTSPEICASVGKEIWEIV
jgi:hypothetical protein